MRVLAWVPAVAIAIAIWIASGTPDLALTTGTPELVLRKTAHVAVFAAFTAAVLLGLRANRVEWSRALPLAAAIGILYGIVDEFHQSTVPTRHGTPVDVAIDALGAGVAVIGGVAVARRGGRR